RAGYFCTRGTLTVHSSVNIVTSGVQFSDLLALVSVLKWWDILFALTSQQQVRSWDRCTDRLPLGPYHNLSGHQIQTRARCADVRPTHYHGNHAEEI
ncbi:hypothetical protein MAR_013772, partial [Mya arenaria]